MPIDDITPLTPVKAYQGKTPSQRRRKGRYLDEDEEEFDDGFDAYHDETSFLGIPQDQLTPEVTQAITNLMAQVDELRSELNKTHSIESLLTESVDHHRDLPVLTHHALVREVAVLGAQQIEGGLVSCFAYLQIANLNQIKDDYGILASDEALKDCAEVIRDNLRTTDRVGTMGGDGFGVLLTLTDRKQALEKIKFLQECIARAPIVYDGVNLRLELCVGLHEIEPGEDVNQIISEADEDRHQ